MEEKKSYHVSYVVIALAAGYFIISLFRAVGGLEFSGLRVYHTIFISILMQAFPFMLVGIFVSSTMHVFLSDQLIIRIFPRKYGLGFLSALIGGIFLPVCECAIVPVTTGLIKKGVPLPISFTFLLAAPIMNPIVIISTLYAFPGNPEVTVMRVILGLIVAILIGLILTVLERIVPEIFLKPGRIDLDIQHSHCSCEHHDCSHHEPNHDDGHEIDCGCYHHSHMHDDYEKYDHILDQNIKMVRPVWKEKWESFFLHAGDEFFGVGKYLVLGASLTSLIQVVFPRSIFETLSGHQNLSLLVMMGLAFVFSACSTSDAFIARSYLDKFPIGSILGFLVFGPMMDIKNLLMLLANFRKTFVFSLCGIIFIVNYLILSFICMHIQ